MKISGLSLITGSVLVAVLAAVCGGYATNFLLSQDSADNYRHALHLSVLLLVPGAFGGLLASLQSDKLEMPRCSNGKLTPGFLSDVGFGIGGSLVVFYLARSVAGPVGGNDSTFLYDDPVYAFELVGVSILGGYAGRKVVQSAAAKLQNRVDQLESEFGRMESGLHADEHAEQMAEKILNCRTAPSPSQIEDLKQAISAASETARAAIYSNTEQTRADRWMVAAKAALQRESGNLISQRDARSLQTVENSQHVFEALINAAAASGAAVEHKSYGSLGFVLHDSRQFGKGIEQLELALKAANGHAPEFEQWYRFDLAQAYAELGDDNAAREQLQKLTNGQQVYSGATRLLSAIRDNQDGEAINDALRRVMRNIRQ